MDKPFWSRPIQLFLVHSPDDDGRRTNILIFLSASICFACSRCGGPLLRSWKSVHLSSKQWPFVMGITHLEWSFSTIVWLRRCSVLVSRRTKGIFLVVMGETVSRCPTRWLQEKRLPICHDWLLESSPNISFYTVPSEYVAPATALQPRSKTTPSAMHLDILYSQQTIHLLRCTHQ